MATYGNKFEISRIVNQIMHSNTFVISCGKEAYLVDVGDIMSVLDVEFNIKGVFITHGHHDHLYGINELMYYFPNCKIYTMKTGLEALRSGRRNLSFHGGDEIVEYHGSNIQILHKGNSIELFSGVELKVYETCYLFTGDSYRTVFFVRLWLNEKRNSLRWPLQTASSTVQPRLNEKTDG